MSCEDGVSTHARKARFMENHSVGDVGIDISLSLLCSTPTTLASPSDSTTNGRLPLRQRVISICFHMFGKVEKTPASFSTKRESMRRANHSSIECRPAIQRPHLTGYYVCPHTHEYCRAASRPIWAGDLSNIGVSGQSPRVVAVHS